MMIQAIWFAGDCFRHYFIIFPLAWPLPFLCTGISRKERQKFCVSIFSTRLLHRPWPLLDIQGPNISFRTTHQVVNWRLQRFNVEMFEIFMFHSTVISIKMLIQTRMILVQNSNVPGVTCVIIVEKCCWTKSSRNLFNNIYTWNVVEQNRLNKESIAPFQRSDVRVFVDLFWSLRLVPLDFQRWEICWKTTLWIAWFCPYSFYKLGSFLFFFLGFRRPDQSLD